MPSTSKLMSCLAAAAPLALAAAFVDDADCDCYVSDGPKPTYFKNHGFWDFRSLSQYAGVPEPISSRQGNEDAPFTSDYFDWDGEFGQFWGPQNWSDDDPDRKIPITNSYNNLYIEANDGGESDTFLTMRTHRLRDFQAVSEFESVDYHNFASMRMLARTTGAAGACTAMFTYREAPEYRDVQETDIEVLTKEPTSRIHYTNQPSVDDDGEEIPESTVVIDMPNGARWDQWLTHRQDWTPGKTLWFVDGEQTAELEFQTPTDASRFTFNSWGDGGVWTGLMDEGAEAYQQIQWIELLYEKTEESQCSRVCSIDEAGEPGKAVRV